MSHKIPAVQLAPTIGCLIFVVLIIVASINYPGGSEMVPNATSYSWDHNYMCDITSDTAINGKPNPYYKIANIAMMFICGGIALFFYFFPHWTNEKGAWNPIIKWMGLASMICAMLIFTPLHNIMIAIASLLGILPLVGVYRTLYTQKKMKFYYAGLLILLLLVLNNLIYYSDYLLSILPRLQKLTFVTVIIWLISMNIEFVKRPSKSN